MNISEFTLIALLVFCPRCILSSKQRPYYNIGHMVNSLYEIEEFLRKGSNVLELDIQFSPNGSVKEIHHGFPCDCGRQCGAKANLEDYLKYIRIITDPNTQGNYYNQLVMLFFDLKLDTSNDKIASGRDIARHVLNYLWSKKGDRKQEIRVLIYFNDINASDVVLGFRNEFEKQGQTSLLKNIGFDGGSGSISDIEQTFAHFEIENVWLGDGIMNCFSILFSDVRLKKEIAIRDSSDGFIDKVYKWTIDIPSLMKKALKLGVDGMITNTPDKLVEVLGECEFKNTFRLATVEDNPFEKYKGK